jgi:hypothetical protein
MASRARKRRGSGVARRINSRLLSRYRHARIACCSVACAGANMARETSTASELSSGTKGLPDARALASAIAVQVAPGAGAIPMSASCSSRSCQAPTIRSCAVPRVLRRRRRTEAASGTPAR